MTDTHFAVGPSVCVHTVLHGGGQQHPRTKVGLVDIDPLFRHVCGVTVTTKDGCVGRQSHTVDHNHLRRVLPLVHGMLHFPVDTYMLSPPV